MGFSLGNLVKGAENFLGGAVHTVENAVGGAENAVASTVHNVIHPNQQAASTVQPVQQAVNFASHFIPGISPMVDITRLIAPAATHIAQDVQNFAPKANQFLTGFSQGAGTAGADLVNTVAHSTPLAYTPMGFALDKLAQPGMDKLAQFGSRNFQAPQPGLESTGYIAGSALGQVPYFAPTPGAAGKVAPLVEDVAKSYVDHIKAPVPNDFSNALDQAGYLAGPKASNVAERVVQGQPVNAEITDAGMKLKNSGVQALGNGQPVHISDVIKHTPLQSDYPYLFDKSNPQSIKLIPQDNLAHAVIDKPNGNLYIPSKLDLKSDIGRKTITEELQHAIDFHEGRISGTTPLREQVAAAPQAYQDAANVAAKLKPNVDNLNSLVKTGNLTPAEAASHPDMVAYKQAIQTQQKLQPQLIGQDEALQRYLANPGEINARTTGERALMNQKDLAANPRDLSSVQPSRGIEPAFSASKDNLPIMGPEITGNKFTQSVKHSPEVSPEVRGQVSGQHEVRNTKDLVSKVQAQIKADPQAALDKTLGELAAPIGSPSDETLARAIEIAKYHDAIGTPEAQDLAARLYDQVSEHGVGKGQGAQILAMLARRSPAGLRNKAFRDLKKAGVEITPKLKAEIQGHIDAIAKLEDGPLKDMAIAALQKTVLKHVPQSKLDNLVSVWKAGLLSGVKTQQGNAISNALFGGLHDLSSPVSVATDKVLSVKTGERTKALTAKGRLSGTVEGAKTGIKTLKTGIDPRNAGDKYDQHAEINFKNPIVQKVLGNPANFIFRGMNAADQPFYYSTLKNSLYDQAKADGINQGLRGSKLRAHMENVVANPTEKMVTTANREAAKSVLAYDTVAAKAINAVHQGIDRLPISTTEKSVAHTVLHVLAPFVRVPTAFLARTVDFTPLGIGREAFIQVARHEFDQRALATAVGEGLTGTGAIALGMSLAGNNLLSGDYPKNDPKQAALWKAQGITANSIKLGNTWISLNYLGPLGLLFRAGQQLENARQAGDGLTTQLAQAIGGLGQGLMSQSFLQGFSGFSNAIQDPQRSAKSFLNSQIGSLVPNISNDIANLLDPMQRRVDGALQAVETRIPGVRNTLPVKTDSLGNPLAQPSGQLDTLIGIKPSQQNHSVVLDEANRLAQAGNSVFPVEEKTIKSGKTTTKLNPDQVAQRDKIVGDLLNPLWTQAINSSQYQQMDDAHKAQMLQNILTDVNTAANRQMLAQIAPDQLNTPANKKVQAILDGSATSQNYLTSPKKTAAPKTRKARAVSSGRKASSRTRVAKNSSHGVKTNFTKLPGFTASKTNSNALRSLVKPPKFSQKKVATKLGKLPKSTTASAKISKKVKVA